MAEKGDIDEEEEYEEVAPLSKPAVSALNKKNLQRRESQIFNSPKQLQFGALSPFKIQKRVSEGEELNFSRDSPVLKKQRTSVMMGAGFSFKMTKDKQNFQEEIHGYEKKPP